MGCFDLFCFVCGNTCHGILDGTIENLQEIYEAVKNKKKIPKHVKEYYKKIYDKMEEDPKFPEKMEQHMKKMRWLNQCTFLTVIDEVIHGCGEAACNTKFVDKKGNEYDHDVIFNIYKDDLTMKTKIGIFIHDDCWDYVKSNYKIDLKYSDIAVIPEEKEYDKINPRIDYGEIEKYWAQDFKFDEVFMDSNEYMCESPLLNEKNGKRINKIITQFKFNTDKNRKGPAVSATFYPENTIKYGINELLWIKSGDKWTEIKDSNKINRIEVELDKINKKQKKYLEKIVCIGQQTDKPILIKSMNKGKGLKKNMMQIEFVGEEKELDKLSKLFDNDKK